MLHSSLRSRGPLLRTLIVTAALVAATSVAVAQGRGGPPPGGGMGHGAFGGNTVTSNTRTQLPPPPSSDSQSTMRGGLQLGPPGRWWDDKGFSKTLGLNSFQQHKMDDAFNTNKPALIKLYKSLRHKESQLEKLTRGKSPDEAQIFQQIDKVTQARGELEKANAHMLLSIRKEMTDEQVSKLDDRRQSE